MDRGAASALASHDHWFRHWMPYEFVRLGPGEGHVYLPLNRGLKPLGVTAPGCVRFGDHRAQAVVFRLDPRTFEGVWFDPAGAAPSLPRPRLLFYDDTPESRMDYFARFERLMARASRLGGAAALREARNGFDGWSSAALHDTASWRAPEGASARGVAQRRRRPCGAPSVVPVRNAAAPGRTAVPSDRAVAAIGEWDVWSRWELYRAGLGKAGLTDL